MSIKKKCEQGEESTLERSQFIQRSGRIEAQVFGEFAAVLRVFMNTEFNVLAERLVELVEVLLIFRDLAEKV